MPKARRGRDNFQRRLIYTTLLSIAASTSTIAQDSESLDCNGTFSFEGLTYDLKSLTSERTVTRIRETPPTTTEDELRFNICQDLIPKDSMPEGDQCPAGTRACLTLTNTKGKTDPRVTNVIPVAQTSLLKPSYMTLHSPDGLSILLHGPSYPPNSSPVPQSFNLTLLCVQDGESEPTFVDYENGITSAVWKTSAGCPAKAGDDSDNNGGGSEGGEKDAGDDANSSGSGIGWFFLLLLISMMGYFAVGAYYNYNNFGATGWDLVPHRDFWRDVPYLLRDFTEHLCSTLRPGRQGSRRGYVAV